MRTDYVITFLLAATAIPASMAVNAAADYFPALHAHPGVVLVSAVVATLIPLLAALAIAIRGERKAEREGRKRRPILFYGTVVVGLACIGCAVWYLWTPQAPELAAHPFTPAAPPPGVVRNTANEKTEVGIFYQSDDLQSDAEKVAGALNAAGYKFQCVRASLDNVIYRGARTHKAAVLIKSTAEFHHMRAPVRDLALRALLDRKPDDIVLSDDDFSYKGLPPDRGVIQVDLY